MKRTIHIHIHDAEISPERRLLIGEYNTLRQKFNEMFEKLERLEAKSNQGRPTQQAEQIRLQEEMNKIQPRIRELKKLIYPSKDAKFTGEYSAVVKGARQSIKATVEAPDAYQAGDKLRALFEKKYGPDPMHPVIKFGSASFDPGIAKKVAKRSGPEEN